MESKDRHYSRVLREFGGLVRPMPEIVANSGGSLAPYVGKWVLHRAQIGTDRIEEGLGSTILDLSLTHYVLTAGMKTESGRFTVDVKTDPLSMDLDAEEGPNFGRKLLAILEVSGDQLKFCYCLTEGIRPRAFFSSERSDIFCAEFVREG